MRNMWSNDGLFYVIIDDNDDEMAPEDVVNELIKLRAEVIRLTTENKRLMAELREERGYIVFDD